MKNIITFRKIDYNGYYRIAAAKHWGWYENAIKNMELHLIAEGLGGEGACFYVSEDSAKVLVEVLDKLGVVDWTVVPERPEQADRFPGQSSCKHPEPLRSEDPRKVPVSKFCSTEGCLVTWDECATMAVALSAWGEDIPWNGYSASPIGRDSDDELAKAFGDYCILCSGAYGFRVWGRVNRSQGHERR